MTLAKRVLIFQRLPTGTVLTLVLPPEKPIPGSLGEIEGTARVRIRGTLRGLEDVHRAEPKVRLERRDKMGRTVLGCFCLGDLLTIEDVVLPANEEAA